MAVKDLSPYFFSAGKPMKSTQGNMETWKLTGNIDRYFYSLTEEKPVS